MKIGYLGPVGTFTEQAAKNILKNLPKVESPQLIPLKSIELVVSSVLDGSVDLAVLPLINTLSSKLPETAQLLNENPDLETISSTRLQIKMALGIHPNARIEQVTEVRSKDVALGQCENALNKDFNNVTQKSTPSTAEAMREIRDENLMNVAAIGSAAGIEHYGLQLVRDDMADNTENYTTFLAIRKTPVS